MRRLIGMTLILGFALTWRPAEVEGQISSSPFSVSVGVGGFGVGLSYTSVDPWYYEPYLDSCSYYEYYEWFYYPCRTSYYGAADPYDYRYYDDYHSRRFVSLSYRYLPSYYAYPASWIFGPGYWTSARLSFGGLYDYRWFGMRHHWGGVNSGYMYGDYAYYNHRAPRTYVGPRAEVASRQYAGRAVNDVGYKESPRSTSATRVATRRSGTATAPAANIAARSDASAISATSSGRVDTAHRSVRSPTRASADASSSSPASRVQPSPRGPRQTGAHARPTVTRARPSDAASRRSSSWSSARAGVSRTQPPSRTGSGAPAVAPSRRAGSGAYRRSDSPGYRTPATMPPGRRLQKPPSARSTPSRASTRSASPSRGQSAPSRSSRPSTRSAEPSRTSRGSSVRSAPSRAPSTRSAPRGSAARRSPSRPSSARSAPRPSSTRSAPARSGDRPVGPVALCGARGVVDRGLRLDQNSILDHGAARVRAEPVSQVPWVVDVP